MSDKAPQAKSKHLVISAAYHKAVRLNAFQTEVQMSSLVETALNEYFITHKLTTPEQLAVTTTK